MDKDSPMLHARIFTDESLLGIYSSKYEYEFHLRILIKWLVAQVM